jgi:hypothetical protein
MLTWDADGTAGAGTAINVVQINGLAILHDYDLLLV